MDAIAFFFVLVGILGLLSIAAALGGVDSRDAMLDDRRR